MHAAEHTKVFCGVLALDDAGDAVLLLVSDTEGVPFEFVVAALDGFLGVLHIVAQEAHGLVVAGAKFGDVGGGLLYGSVGGTQGVHLGFEAGDIGIVDAQLLRLVHVSLHTFSKARSLVNQCLCCL